jgi:disulfide bond formation protein DsbB
LPDLNNDPVVTCEQAALRIFGLSLAGWNAVISFALAALAWSGFRKAR